MKVLIFCLLFLIGGCTVEKSLPIDAVIIRDTTYLPADTLFLPCRMNVDSIIHANDSLTKVSDTLAKKLLYSRLVISNLSYYIDIVVKNPSQVKFLKGWKNRAIK